MDADISPFGRAAAPLLQRRRLRWPAFAAKGFSLCAAARSTWHRFRASADGRHRAAQIEKIRHNWQREWLAPPQRFCVLARTNAGAGGAFGPV